MPRHSPLIHPVQPVKIQTQGNVAELLRGMGETAFQRKNLSFALPLIVTAVAQESKAFLPARPRPEMENLWLTPGKRKVLQRRKSPRR